MKAARQNKILEIISKNEIDTQEELISYLKAEGMNVTQATISRDMKELKLTKTLTARGTYRYVVNQARHNSNNVKFNNAVIESITYIDYSGINVVIKTLPGLAQAVASSVDAINLPSVLGCVAGDDTIIIVTRDEECSRDISEKIRELMKTF